MKTLAQHNVDAGFVSNPKKLAGVKCDRCPEEMQYGNQVIVTDSPPKRRVVCPACNYSGFKVIKESK